MAGFEERRVGRYVLTARLGEGGMGTAYLGRAEGAEGFARKLVLKCLLPAAKKHVKYFIAEAKIGARLHHENIVSVADFFEADAALYIVMEYVHGADLKRLVRVHRKLPLPVALHVVRAVALGLHHAHEARDDAGNLLCIVHRDMSPDNVLVSADGLTKVTDFGVARADGLRTKTEAAGGLKGKFSYMDPAMLRGQEVDRRADVYAVSVILWELLTGRVAFPPMSSVEALVVKVLNGDLEQLRVLAPELPEALYALVERGMASDPSARIATCEQLADELEAIMPECASRKTQRELARLVTLAMGTSADGEDDESPPPGMFAAAAVATIARNEPQTAGAPPSLVAMRSAEPWKTTLRPDGGADNVNPLDRMAVPQEIHDDAPFIAVGAGTASEVASPADTKLAWTGTPLLDPADAENARLRRASRATKPIGAPVVEARRDSRRTLVIGGLVTSVIALSVIALAARHHAGAAARPAVDAHEGDTTVAVGTPPVAHAQAISQPTPPAAVPRKLADAPSAAVVAPRRQKRQPRTAEDGNAIGLASSMTRRAHQAYDGGRYADGIMLASQALAVRELADAYSVRGACEIRLGRNADAERDFRDALKLAPTDATSRDGLAFLKEQAAVR